MEFQELLLISLRLLEMQIINAAVCFYMVHLICRFKGSLWLFLSYLFLQIVVINNVVSTVMNHYYGEEDWYRIGYMILSVASHFAIPLILNVFYEGGIVKVTMAEIVSEGIACTITTVLFGIVNQIQGREYIFVVMKEKVRLEDLWIFPIAACVYGVLFHIAAPYLKRLRGRNVGFTKVTAVVMIIYYMAAIPTLFGTLKGYGWVVTGGVGMILFGLGIYGFYRYQQHVRKQHQLLTQQQKLMEVNYRMTQEWFRNLEENVERLEEKRNQIQAAGYEVNSERLKGYLEELKKQYQKIAAGRYCSDRLVDAVLCYQAGICMRQGIPVDFYMQKYDRGEIEEQDLMQLFLQMLEFGVRENQGNVCDEKRSLSLHVSTVKNQLLIEFACASGKKKLPMSMLKYCLRKYRGHVWQKGDGERLEVRIMLEEKGGD